MSPTGDQVGGLQWPLLGRDGGTATASTSDQGTLTQLSNQRGPLQRPLPGTGGEGHNSPHRLPGASTIMPPAASGWPYRNGFP